MKRHANQHGEMNLNGAIPRVRFVPEADEDRSAYMARVAAATAFAYTMPNEQFRHQPGFSYEVESIVLPGGTIARGRVRGQVRLVRDAALVATTGADVLFVYLIVSGTATVRTQCRFGPLEPGDIFVHDLAEPIEILLDGYEVLMLVIGRGVLPETVQQRAINGAVIPRSHPLAGLAMGVVGGLHDSAPRMRLAHAAVAFDLAMTLLGAALADVTFASRSTVPVKAGAETIIDASLGEPDLSPAVIAQRLGVSRATLYRAFQDYGGVRRVIADRRLHRAWSSCTARPAPAAAAVAKACGYASTSQLDKALRGAFGLRAQDIAALPDDQHDSLKRGATMVLTDNRRLITREVLAD